MPTRLCSTPRCPEPAHYRGRCTNCNRANEQRTQRAGRGIYNTKRWRLLRRRVLFEQPLCPGYDADTCDAIATDVDHITAIQHGGDPWARANLQGLCGSCHSRKTRQEQQVKSA